MPIFYAHKRADGLEFERKPLYDAYVAGLKPDTRYEVTIKRYRAKRSDAQNKYYWGVVVQMIADETGNNKDMTHDGLRSMFLIDKTGKMPVIRSTTSMTTKEFMEYIDTVVLWAAEFLGVIVPPPDYVED